MVRFPACVLSVFLAFAISGATHARQTAPDLSVEKTFLIVRIGTSLNRLEALIVKEASRSGRLPIALINHGKPAGNLRMSSIQAERYLGVARDFAARGYLAVALVRRGYGRSDGPIPVTLNCSSTSLAPRFDSAADDINAAFKVLANRPDADPLRAIAIGVSAGGAAVLAWAARNPPGLKAVINISGGLSFPKCSKDDILVQTFGQMGKVSRVPSLWLYSTNDSLFPPG
ncbi:MAG: lysophospholipase, partial [Beijerinckiaceae bacterium]|nr:lysophospholipase [Beijerinckiaceae bacterium]